jgi:hypothetical protein
MCEGIIMETTVIAKLGIAAWRLPYAPRKKNCERSLPNGGICTERSCGDCGNTAGSERSSASVRFAPPRLPQLGRPRRSRLPRLPDRTARGLSRVRQTEQQASQRLLELAPSPSRSRLTKASRSLNQLKVTPFAWGLGERCDSASRDATCFETRLRGVKRSANLLGIRARYFCWSCGK